MSELITKARAFLHRDAIEEINYTGANISPEAKNRKWLKRSIVGLVGYLSFLAVDNAIYYYDTARVNADDGEMLYDVDGCPEFPKVTVDPETQELIIPPGISEEQAKTTIDIEIDQQDTESAASKFEPKDFNFLDATIDWIQINSHEQFSFTSEITGLEVNVFSDTKNNPFEIEDMEQTTETMDMIIHSSLDERVKYEHVGVSAYIDCLRKRFVAEDGPRELEGESLNIYIPSKPGVCFKNGVVQEFPDGASFSEFCKSLAFTKDIRISFRPFYVYRQFWMTIMSNNKTPQGVEHELTRLLVHEPSHMFLESVGMKEMYDPNERLADEIEKSVREQLFAEGLPHFLSYPDEAYEDIAAD